MPCVQIRGLIVGALSAPLPLRTGIQYPVMQPMTLVVSFNAKTPFGSRAYELDDVTVKVRGDIPLKGDFEITITL